jgi:alkaline phosphatase
MGLFGAAEGHLPFQTANGDHDPAAGNLPTDDEEVDTLRKKYGSAIRYTEADLIENPTLAEMATVAMDTLGRREKFWLMVEAGEVDWASHANNIDNCVGAVRSGDAAVRAVFDWIERHDAWDDAVVIVTSDHGHAFVLTDPEAFAGGL